MQGMWGKRSQQQSDESATLHDMTPQRVVPFAIIQLLILCVASLITISSSLQLFHPVKKDLQTSFAICHTFFLGDSRCN